MRSTSSTTDAIHVYREAGFTVEGTRRDALRWDGVFYDAVLMSVLAPEWRAGQRRYVI